MRLDTDLIARRRHELGITTRTLGYMLGGSALTATQLEAVSSHDSYTLATLERLADALALDPGELLETKPAPEPSAEAEEVARRLGGILHHQTDATPATALAEALGVSLDVLHQAAETLDQMLRPAGMRVHTATGGYALWAEAAVDTEALTTTARYHQGRSGLRAGETEILWQILAGSINRKNLSNPQRISLGALRRAGIIEPDTLDVTEDARYSLMLGE